MRVDITKREVGAFFGGKPGRDISVLCPVCNKPALLIRKSVRNGKQAKYYTHAFELKLESGEAKCVWDPACVETVS